MSAPPGFVSEPEDIVVEAREPAENNVYRVESNLRPRVFVDDPGVSHTFALSPESARDMADRAEAGGEHASFAGRLRAASDEAEAMRGGTG